MLGAFNTKHIHIMSTFKRINKAINHTGLTLHGNRGDGCYYFLDDNGNPCNCDSVYVSALSHLSIKQWVYEAEEAMQHKEDIGETLPAVIRLRKSVY